MLVPSGSTELHAGDKLGLAAATADLPALLHRFGIRTLDVKNVMIIGGSAIARYLATDLLRSGLHVTILEMDLKKCEVLEDLLPGAAIIHGDGSLQHVLAEEGIANMDAVVPLTGIDEENIMISLYAHSIGTKKTITKVNRTEYVNLFGQEHLGAVVSPKVLTANEITRYARAASQTREGSVETLHTLGGGSIESLGFTVPEDAPFVNKPIMELPLQPSILIASIVRKQPPRGGDFPAAGDCGGHGIPRAAECTGHCDCGADYAVARYTALLYPGAPLHFDERGLCGLRARLDCALALRRPAFLYQRRDSALH